MSVWILKISNRHTSTLAVTKPQIRQKLILLYLSAALAVKLNRFKKMRNYHNLKCVKGFGRISPKGVCPRCDELRKGARPRSRRVKGTRYDDKGRALV